MIRKRLRARLLAVAGLLTPAPAAVAADAAPPPLPITYAPAFAPVVADCPTGCGEVGVVGPVFGGFTGLGGAAGNGIGLFAPNPPRTRRRQMIDGQQQPACAVNSFPLSDWAYIRRYCGPTIIPGTCYGHFQTKWRKWEDHCPQGAAGCAPGSTLPVFDSPPATIYAPLSPSPASQPLPPPQAMPPMKMDEPKKSTEPEEPKKPKTADTSSLLAPALPDIPGFPEPQPLRSTLK